MDRPGVDLGGAPAAQARPSRLWLAVAVATEPMVLLCLVHLTVLAWRLPLFDRLPGWVFTTHQKRISPIAFVLLAVIPLATAAAVYSLRRRVRVAIACLALGGFLFQQGLAWSEGRGLDGMRERIIRSGHAEFADVAVAQRSLWSVTTRYEVKVQGGELGRYAHSKPPGTLLTYMATERLSRLFAGSDAPEMRLASLRTTAAIVWPMMSYVVLFPLFAAARRLAGDNTAWLACALYAVVPSVSLVTLHTDQFLFPLLAMLAILITMEAAARGTLVLAAGAGLWLWTIGFFTFPLWLIAPVAVGCAWAARDPFDESHSTVMAPRTVALSRLVAAMCGGFAVGFVTWRAAFGYDVLARFADARHFNAVWKGWEGGAFQTLYFAWMNTIEFVLWAGIPVVLLTAGRVRRALLDLTHNDVARFTIPALAAALVFGYLAFRSEAKGETARLWLFMAPVCCMLAADELRSRWRENGLAAAAVVVLALQWLTVVLTKTGQDFF